MNAKSAALKSDEECSILRVFRGCDPSLIARQLLEQRGGSASMLSTEAVALEHIGSAQPRRERGQLVARSFERPQSVLSHSAKCACDRISHKQGELLLTD